MIRGWVSRIEIITRVRYYLLQVRHASITAMITEIPHAETGIIMVQGRCWSAEVGFAVEGKNSVSSNVFPTAQRYPSCPL